MVSRLNIRQIGAIAALLIAVFIALFPITGYPDTFSYSASVILITLTCWSASLLPPFLTGLLFFALSIIFKLIEPTAIFAGFGSSAVWLIISGFIIGSAIVSSGFDKKLASFIAPHLTVSYPRLIAGLVVSSMLLGFIMPSSVGRAVVLIPIGMALADKVGFVAGSNGRVGIATALAIACNMPSFAVLPANIPNMILAGASETLFGIHFAYMDYLLLHFPILGIVKSALLVLLVLKLFPDSVKSGQVSQEKIIDDQAGVNKSLQKKVAALLGLTLLFWITDSWHGINPAWVGLVTAILLLIPKWGVVSPKDFNKSVDFGTVIFVSAALGLGTLVNHSGVGVFMGEAFANLIPSSTDNSFFSFISLSLISTFTGLVTTTPGVPTVLAPMAENFSNATDFSLAAVLMTQVIGFSTVIFPYQVAPLVLAMQLSKESLGNLTKLLLLLSLLTIVLLMPLDYLWWKLLGWI